jgi:ABC-type branched-subunit amino acid transport system permease subunit
MQASFVTIGGFAGGWAMTHDWGVDIPLVASHGQINFLWALVIGALAAATLGALLAIPITRLGGVNFALGTLAWAACCSGSSRSSSATRARHRSSACSG